MIDQSKVRISFFSLTALLIMALFLTACGGTAATQVPEDMADPTEGATMAPTADQEGDIQAGVTVRTSESELGTILVGPEGYSLYILTADSPGEITCDDVCADAWPPLLTVGEPQAGEGVDQELLGTQLREDGSVQVTYNDWPLYYFANEPNPGAITGQAIESYDGAWYVIGPDGDPINGDVIESGTGDNGDTY